MTRLRDSFRTDEVGRALVAVFVARTGINASIRVVLPFLPAIARGLDTTLATVGALVAARSLVGVCAPGVARFAERVGRRRVMVAALIVAAAGNALVGLAPGLAAAAVGFVLVGLGKPGFDVPMQGWFGDRVRYARRGRVLGMTELTWALGLLVSVPLSGWLIARTSWRAQFAVVAVLTVLGIAAVVTLMEDDRPATRVTRPLRLTRARVAVVLVVFSFGLAAEGLFVVYGAWLEQDFGFDTTAIGLFTVIVVGAELIGEGAVAAVGDRIGLRRAVQTALLVSACAYVALRFVDANVAAAVVVVVVWFVAYEISIVATVPLVTELGGDGRDRLIGLVIAGLALARAVGALGATRLFASGGVDTVALLAAGCAVVAWAVLTMAVPDPASLQVRGSDGAS